MKLQAIKLLFLLCLISYNTFAQSTADTIHWKPNYKLKWEDFQGVPDPNDSINGAISSCGLYYYPQYTNDTSFILIVDAVFDKKKSWVKVTTLNDYSLNHEQGHFNISDIYARKLQIVFLKYKLRKNSINEDLQQIYYTFYNEMNDMQHLYDKETTHPSINKQKQKEWDKKIAAWLKEYPSE